jgi:hypothetical protein
MSTLGFIQITCPNCSTCYALSTHSILTDQAKDLDKYLKGEVETLNANFHCSKCDYSFQTQVEAEALRVETKAAQEIDTNKLKEAFTEQKQIEESIQAIDEQPLTKATSTENVSTDDNSTEAFEAFSARASDLTEEAAEEKTQVIHEDILEQIKQSTAQDRLVQDLVQSSWGEPLNPVQASGADDWSSFNTASVSTTSKVNNTEDIDYSQYAIDNYRDMQDTTNQGSGLSGHTAFTDQDQSDPEIYSDNTGNTPVNNPSRSTLSAKRIPTDKSTYASIAAILSPIIIVIIGLGYLSFHLKSNVKSADLLFSKLLPSALREAPAGLFIQQTQIRPLVLENGDVVNVVEAKIVNNSAKTIEAIQVEGLGFANAGNISQRERIMLGNPISARTVKLKSLTPTSIRELQSREMRKSINLRPNAKLDFVLVFTEPVNPKILESPNANDLGSKDMTSFALRVFGVKS